MTTLQCCMTDCEEKVTHICNKGFVYCQNHADVQRYYRGVRKMRNWEVLRLEIGKTIWYQAKPQSAYAE